jgi:hypothetical protein
LPEVPEANFTPAELESYSELVRQIRKAGTETATPVEAVILAAKQRARMEAIRQRVAGLPDIVVRGSLGQQTLHPLVKELRVLEVAYSGSIGRLLLTTRAALSGSSRRAGPSEGPSAEDAGETTGILRLMKASGE